MFVLCGFRKDSELHARKISRQTMPTIVDDDNHQTGSTSRLDLDVNKGQHKDDRRRTSQTKQEEKLLHQQDTHELSGRGATDQKAADGSSHLEEASTSPLPNETRADNKLNAALLNRLSPEKTSAHSSVTTESKIEGDIKEADDQNGRLSEEATHLEHDQKQAADRRTKILSKQENGEESIQIPLQEKQQLAPISLENVVISSKVLGSPAGSKENLPKVNQSDIQVNMEALSYQSKQHYFNDHRRSTLKNFQHDSSQVSTCSNCTDILLKK